MRRLEAFLAGLDGWRRWMVAFLLGAAGGLALPPFYLLPLLVVAFTGLLWLARGCRSWRAAAASGWWFGFGYFVVGLNWVSHAFLVEAEIYGWLALPAMLSLCAGLALFSALAVALARACRASGPAEALALAVAWTVAEWLRGHAILNGFPWNLAGYAWTFSDAAMQPAALFGAYGLTLVTVAAAAMPAALATSADRAGARRAWGAVALAAAAVLLGWSGGALRLALAEAAPGPDVRVRIVQASIPQDLKWDASLQVRWFERYLALSRSPGAEDIDVVVWPEAASPFPLDQDPIYRRLIGAATPPGGFSFVGARRWEEDPSGGPSVWNSLYLIDSRGEILSVYDKVRLVPFGEFVPFASVLDFVRVTGGPVGFTAGREQPVFTPPGVPPVAPLICYEAAFPGQVVGPDGGARWLLNVTNDAWFGESAGPYQHLATARLRAVEEGVPLVRAANTGISVVTDAYGRVVARLGLNEAGTLDAGLPPALPSPTPYARFGDWTLVPLMGLAGLLLARGGRRGAPPVRGAAVARRAADAPAPR